MRAISLIAAGLMSTSALAFAGPAPSVTTSGASAPVAVAPPPAPPELAPLTQDFQAAMANSQLQTYRYNQLTEQALALKKLCETGFGPADICPKASRDSGTGLGDTADGRLPTVDRISGIAGALTASIMLADGRRLAARSGEILPGGIRVASVSGDGVAVVLPNGRREVLPFGMAGAGQ